jgi:hypothetical protein
MKSPDLKNWFNAFGEPVELPATIENKSLVVDPIPPGGGIINLAARVCLDENNSPVFIYHKYAEDENLQVFVAQLEGYEWVSKQITDWDHRWKFSGRGSIVFDVRLKDFKRRNDGFYEFSYWHVKYGNGIVLLDETFDNAGRVVKSEPFEETLQLEGNYPGLQVRTTEDIGKSGEDGIRYLLKWETLLHNRDLPRPEPYPAPSRLYLYKLKKSESF